jgi:hypothetical protein
VRWRFALYARWLLLRSRLLGWWRRWFPSGGELAPRRFLELIGELHRRGYEGLRLEAGLAPSGCYWRGAVSVKDGSLRVGAFSSGAGWQLLFNWPDARRLSVQRLAERFLAEFPEIAAHAFHRDPAYAAWYARMLRLTAPRGVVYFSADFDLPASGVGVAGCPANVEIDAPPA